MIVQCSIVQVFIILSGDFDETDVRQLEDNRRKTFRRGSTNAFLMAVPRWRADLETNKFYVCVCVYMFVLNNSVLRPLGPVQYLRLWHDNSGKGKYQGWYCRYVMVHDLQTKEKFFFIVQNWFAVEESDGQV